MIYFCVSTIGAAEAGEFARRLVEERLVACVNILDCRSIYRWEGKVRDESESVLLIKTAPRTLGEFEDRFRDLHPYDVPELLIMPVEDGTKEYLAWVEEMTGNGGKRPHD